MSRPSSNCDAAPGGGPGARFANGLGRVGLGFRGTVFFSAGTMEISSNIFASSSFIVISLFPVSNENSISL